MAGPLTNPILPAEAVLCLLLAKFTFAPSGKKIVWNLSNVRFPTVGDDSKPSMPMKVGLYKAPPPPSV